ncbi:hypothetical protein [Nocardioides sp. R-C-SC26]|uniref:hypothetical protein n=1 Tax=Nocardioides sp. R-C-SC26 TaxID=2870414 RepID=UPI001E42146D|nr:hypothetical protein [Nocardioides sp. R-C-SC26]
MRPIPEELTTGPFTYATAALHGVPGHMLTGRRFTRIYPRVWRWTGLELTHRQQIEAARLALPADARLTGITRLQIAGFNGGPLTPLRFVVARDHHISLDGIFLHRTKRLPPTDEVGVTPAAAFVAYCGLARVIDVIQAGDWLLAQGLMTTTELGLLVTEAPWRAGAHQAGWVLRRLRPGVASRSESVVRTLLDFAGVEVPEVNGALVLDGRELHSDLLYRRWGLVIEFEGRQHQADRVQYLNDLGRYARYRDHGLEYLQLTGEDLRTPQHLVRRVHRALVRRGYDGAQPDFGGAWRQLWRSVTAAAGPRPDRADLSRASA